MRVKRAWLTQFSEEAWFGFAAIRYARDHWEDFCIWAEDQMDGTMRWQGDDQPPPEIGNLLARVAQSADEALNREASNAEYRELKEVRERVKHDKSTSRRGDGPGSGS